MEESEKMPHMGNQLRSSNLNSTAVQADLALLYQELGISLDILAKIRESIKVLELSLLEQE